jgi:hypothetical protein
MYPITSYIRSTLKKLYRKYSTIYSDKKFILQIILHTSKFYTISRDEGRSSGLQENAKLSVFVPYKT